MSHRTIQPDGLFDARPMGYSHAVESRGSRLIHCAGQVAWTPDFETVGAGDLATQTRQALANLQTVLKAADADIEDLVRLRMFVVAYTPEKMADIAGALTAFFTGREPPANTLIGVQALAHPAFLIEIEGLAQTD